MLSLQNFTKNCSDGWGGVIYLFLTSMLEEVLWPVLLLTLWNLVDFLGIIIDTVKSSGFSWHNIPQPDDRDGSVSLS